MTLPAGERRSPEESIPEEGEIGRGRLRHGGRGGEGTMWSIQLLGGLCAAAEDRTVTHFRTQKTALLLAYLAYFGQRSHSREELIEMLWPGCKPEAGRSGLSRELCWLRAQLEPGAAWTRRPAGTLLVADRFSVRLNPAGFTTDSACFEAALLAAGRADLPADQARFLTQAVELYRGELLPGYHEDWILGPRQWLAERYVYALGELLSLAREEGDLRRALDYARRLVSADPLQEESHHQVIQLLAALGQPAAALQQFRALERILREQLSELPDAAIQELAREIETSQRVRPGSVVPGSAGPGPGPGFPPRHWSEGWDRCPSSLAPLRGSPAPASEAGGTPALPGTPEEPTSGAVPLDSPYYVVRPADAEFEAAVDRQDGLVLVKGARQMGKTSLLARGLHRARQAGCHVVLTDFQMLNAAQLESVEALLLTLGEWIAQQLEIEVLPRDVWSSGCGPSINFELYLRRQILNRLATPVVWGMDEVDRLFPCAFAGEVFGLFRSWHNRRSLDPVGPWSRLTLALTYATEAHLFITDLNQSPFNVGTRVALEAFDLEQVSDLNRRYRCPLRTASEVSRFFEWVGGQSYLAHRGIQMMAARGVDLATLEPQLGSETGIFGDHLRRVLLSVTQDPELREAVKQVLEGHPCPSVECFYRLRSAGVLAGEAAREARPRCRLYAVYLKAHLT
jgi:DNA-binding SARP family transcriptional activator